MLKERVFFTWQVDFDSWKIDSFFRSEFAAVHNFANDFFFLNFDRSDVDQTVVDEDLVALFDHFRQVLVVDEDLLLGARLEVFFVERKRDFVAFFEIDDGGSAARKKTGSDFGTFCVQRDRNRFKKSLLFAQVVDRSSEKYLKMFLKSFEYLKMSKNIAKGLKFYLNSVLNISKIFQMP